MNQVCLIISTKNKIYTNFDIKKFIYIFLRFFIDYEEILFTEINEFYSKIFNTITFYMHDIDIFYIL